MHSSHDPNLLNYLNSSYVPPLDRQIDLKIYAKKLKEKSEILYFNIEDKCIGILAYYLRDKVCFITSISIHKDYHGNGYGKLYFNYFIDKIRKKSVKEIILEVHPINIRAIGFYEKYGFSLNKLAENNKIIARKILKNTDDIGL